MPPSNCPICQSDSIALFIPSAKDYITLREFQIWRCSNCQIAFTAPNPEDMSKYYPERYRKYNKLIVQILEILYRLRARKWSNRFPKPGTAFEMGCGNGIMLSALQKAGWQVSGNERTISAAAFARQNFDLPVFVGDLDALTTTPFADLVIMFQVLEHLPDPISSLRSLHQVIKPQGKLVIGVPNIHSWQAVYGGSVWFHLDVPRHLFHYSVPSLEYCLNKTGFKVLQVNFQSMEHDPFGWVQSALNRATHSHNYLTKTLMGLEKTDIRIFPVLVLAILAGIISLPISLISWLFKRGAIMEIIAEKIEI